MLRAEWSTYTLELGIDSNENNQPDSQALESILRIQTNQVQFDIDIDQWY